MEIFSYQIELIRKMGFGDWIKTYPVNPFTIVLIVLIIGFIVLAVNVKTKKKNAERSKVEGAALLILKKQNSFNNNFAEQIRVMEINGERAEWFFYKTRPALYLKPGKNELIVYAEWAQSIRKIIKTAPRKIVINVDYDSIYTIYYKIETDEYLLYKGDEYEDKKWEQKLSTYNIVN